MGLLLAFIVQTLLWEVYSIPPIPPTITTTPAFLNDTEENTTVINSNKSLCNSNVDVNGERFILHKKPLHWFDAMRACWNEGQQLAVPRSPQEAKALGALLFTVKSLSGEENSDALHVGIHDISESGIWHTLDGSLLSEAGYDLWLEGGEGQCGALFADGHYLRQQCGNRLRFACEKPHSETAAHKANDYIQLGDAGRFRLHEEPLPWPLALQNCEADGTTLAVPASAREAGLLAGVMMTRSPDNAALREHGFFVGITDVMREGEWRTLWGDTLSTTGYNEWTTFQPSHSRRENCGTLLQDGRYGQHSCMSPLAYCCQEIPAPRDSEETVLVKGRYRFHKKPLPWFDALQACQRENATFMSVTAREMTHVKDLMMRASDRTYYSEPNINQIHASIYDLTGNDTWKRIYAEGDLKERYQFTGDMNDDYNTYDDQQSNDEDWNVRTENDVLSNCVSMRYSGTYYIVNCAEPLPYVCKRK